MHVGTSDPRAVGAASKARARTTGWCIQQISRDSSVTVLIVEQKVREVLKIAQRVYVLRNGKVSFTGPATDLQDDQRLKQVYL
jgi:ABC-type branched-subunit amino acid transport system ATPase component